MNNMSNVKVGDWVVNIGDSSCGLTIGANYKVKEAFDDYINIIDDDDYENDLRKGNYKLAPQKYRNPPREEYRELCEAMLAGAELQVEVNGRWIEKGLFLDGYNYRVNPDSILPPVDERKERIKKQLLNINADKLAQLIIDAGIEL
jgi:intein/homing endonuclease